MTSFALNCDMGVRADRVSTRFGPICRECVAPPPAGTPQTVLASRALPSCNAIVGTPSVTVGSAATRLDGNRQDCRHPGCSGSRMTGVVPTPAGTRLQSRLRPKRPAGLPKGATFASGWIRSPCNRHGSAPIGYSAEASSFVGDRPEADTTGQLSWPKERNISCFRVSTRPFGCS